MDAQDYRAASQDIRALASKMKCTETQETLHLLADAYELLAEYVRSTSGLTSADAGLVEGRGPGSAKVAEADGKSQGTR